MTALTKPRDDSFTTAGVFIWAVFPCLAMFAGLYTMHSATWAYVFYHGICLLPIIIWGRGLWIPSLKRPKKGHCLALLAASVVFSCVALFTYEFFGPRLLSNDSVLTLLKDLGYSRGVFIGLGVYTIVVNPLLEEIFWRGIVFNQLDKLRNPPFKHFGIICSSIAYAAFHYLIFRMVLFPGWAEVATLLLAIYGGLLAIIYRRSGSILTTAIAHGLLTDTAVIALCVALFMRYPGTF